jgi:hypothetical protein
MQALEDGCSSVFLVTDQFQGFRYIVMDKGSHYQIEVPTQAGYAKVAVSLDVDVIDMADKLNRVLRDASQACLAPRVSVRELRH